MCFRNSHPRASFSPRIPPLMKFMSREARIKPRLARCRPRYSYPGSEKSFMLWFPWATRTRGKGPGPSGYQTRAFRGKESGLKPQYLFRLFALPPRLTSFDASTDPVSKATESRNSGRFLSVPLP